MKEDAANTMPDAVRSFESVTEDAHIGRYRIVRRLETNPISEVVLAVTEGAFGFERAVAIKRLLPHAHADPKRARSFGREASAYARLTHPAIVRLYDFFTVDEMPAMVLEHVEGVSLQTLLEQLRARGETLPTTAVLYIGTRIFAALAAAHSARDPATGAFSPVIHRDVSPANILVGRDGEVKLANFGFAKLIVGDSPAATDTGVEAPKGTLEYMAPEQLLGGPIAPRTDLYAGALVLRELLSGTPAFVRGSEAYVDYLQAIAKPSLAPVATVCPDLPRAVALALESALEPDVEKRAATAVGVQRQLNAHRAGGRAKLLEVLARLGLAQTSSDEPADEEPEAEPAHSSVAARSRLRGPGRARWARLAATLGACAILFGVGALRSDGRAARGGTSPVSALAPSLAPPPPVQAPAPPTEPAAPPVAPSPSPVPTTGGLRASPSTPGHRVFVDDQVVGDSGSALTLPCGAHTVRIGGSGKAQHVTVPCGGNVVVSAR